MSKPCVGGIPLDYYAPAGGGGGSQTKIKGERNTNLPSFCLDTGMLVTFNILQSLTDHVFRFHKNQALQPWTWV